MSLTSSSTGYDNRRKTWIALLGQRDAPTDGVEDYCTFLGRALKGHGVGLTLVRVQWIEQGWLRAMRHLWRESVAWCGTWVLVQYTALGWSRRGISIGVLVALEILRHRGVRVAVVFHDSNTFPGSGVRRQAQSWMQRKVMRAAYRYAERSFFTIPPERMTWLPSDVSKARFIPIGANIPVPNIPMQRQNPRPRSSKTIVIFGVTNDANEFEISQIRYAVSRAKEIAPHLTVKVLGRGSMEAREALESAFHGTGVTVTVLGILPEEIVANHIADADVLLFVRGHLTGRRSSALAGIACGLPIVGFAGPETCSPLTEAGVELAPAWDRDALAGALMRVLSDDVWRQELCERSRRAQEEYFSWEKIAERFAVELANA
jgi:glycosyltransferase involved in cell wall biosynthesis